MTAKVKEKNITPLHDAPTFNKDAHGRLQKFMNEEKKMVKGRFRCFESPGGSTRVMVKKYKELPMFDKWMFDNEVYEIPLYIARHLNGVDVTAEAINGQVGSCSYVVNGFKMGKDEDLKACTQGVGPNGEGGVPVPIVGVTKRVRRYGFESLEFGTD